MRRDDAIEIQEITHQQVVNVTAVAWDIDNFIIRRQFLEFSEMAQLYTVVDLVPEPLQGKRSNPDEVVRVIGGNFESILAGLLSCLLLVAFVFLCLVFNGSFYRWA